MKNLSEQKLLLKVSQLLINYCPEPPDPPPPDPPPSDLPSSDTDGRN